MTKEEQKLEKRTEYEKTGLLPALDIERERELLQQRTDSARQEAELRADREVEEGTQALLRAEEEAQPGYQSLRDRIDIDERQALDNQALYAELRGDRGGIGQAQYGSIQNAAALSRRQVDLEQQRLAADTARQIEALRRQGEFQKADAVLALTQKHLSELMELERWAKEQNLSIDEFNTELKRWKAEYVWQVRRFGVETELDLAKLAATLPDGSATYAARQANRSLLGDAAKTLESLGLALSPELLAAQDWTDGSYEDFIARGGTAAAAAASGGSGRAKKKEDKPAASGAPLTAGADKAQDGKTKRGADGAGAPAQLVAAWAGAIQNSESPAEALAQMRESKWYGQMSVEQRMRIQNALKDRAKQQISKTKA